MAEGEFDPKTFPYPIVTVETAAVLAERARLAKEGVAVILGDDERTARVAADIAMRERTAREMIAAAVGLRFPEDWLAEQARRTEAARAFLAANPQPRPQIMISLIANEDGEFRNATAEEVAAMEARGERGPDAGEWPETPEAMEFSAGSSYPGRSPRRHIAILPTHDVTEAPAYLNFGGWNENPPPEHHIAALRDWRDRFGAELVTCGCDLLELSIGRRPASREAALALAHEQYAYCNDLIDQGFDDFARLASALTVSDWWSFWWD
jgi:hypothetical protein